MSYTERLSEYYNNLISGNINEIEISILYESEKLFFKESDLYIKKYLGILYFFYKEYLLAYSLLKNESDNISKFFFLYSLLKMGYINEAREHFKQYNNVDILKNSDINISYRVEVAFLLGLTFNFEENSEKEITKFLIKLMKNFNNEVNDNNIISCIYNYGDQHIINEIKNRLSSHNYKDLKIFKHEYNDCFIELYSYSKTIGNNMYLLKFNGKSIIIDCGADTKNSKIDFDSFFKKCNVEQKDILAIFFTHSHLDHIGSSLYLIDYFKNKIPYYLTLDTQSLALIGNQIYLDDNNLHFITYNTTISLNKDINITCVRNGHILGSTALIFTLADKKLLFTSDFCIHDQSTIKGMNLHQISSFLGNKLDYLVIESTYGTNLKSLHYSENLELFKILMKKLIHYEKKILLPAYAIGRSQEILNIIVEDEDFAKYSINILGKANDVSLYYQKSVNVEILNSTTIEKILLTMI